MNKNILVVLQTKNGIIENLKLNLIKNNYNPFFYPSKEYQPKLPNFVDKCINLIVYFLFPKLNYLNYLQEKRESIFYKKELNNLLSQKELFFDYSIIFRSDSLSDDLLCEIKKRSKKFIAYQWDGLDRYPTIYSKISFFDDFFCFDPEDCKKNIKFISNFYFDYKSVKSNIKTKWDITYIGYYTEDRFELLEKISKKTPNLKMRFELKAFNNNDILNIQNSKHIIDIDNVYNYDTLLDIHLQSQVILDIKVDVHNGLSFRFFEAMQLKRKIITTNREVKFYDFFHPNNIFILKDDNFKEIENFLKLPYEELLTEVKEKYSFTNWFKNIINNEDKVLIEKPISNRN